MDNAKRGSSGFENKPDRRRSSRRRVILFSFIAVIGFLIAAELGIRTVCWATGFVPEQIRSRWSIPDDDLLYHYRAGYKGRIYAVETHISRQGMRGAEVAKAKPEGVRRILCLGDSRTFGYCVKEDETYVAQLERTWNQSHPETPVEVLNAGVHGYSSFQGLRYLEKSGLDYDPDVVTVAFGFNDRRYAPDAESTDGADWFRRVARHERWRHRMTGSYLLLSIGKAGRWLFGWERETKDKPHMRAGRLEDVPCRVGLESFRQNLEEIAETCREHNIACVFVDMDDTPLAVKPLEEGWRLLGEKHYDEAIEAFSTLFQAGFNREIHDWEAPLAHHGIGVALYGKGLFGEAEGRFRQCVRSASNLESTLGGYLIRHSNSYCETVRVAARNCGVPFVDIAKQLSDRPEVFADFCHYTPQGHREIAQALARVLEDVLSTARE